MKAKKSALSKKERSQAIARARARLDARKDGNELWTVVSDYALGRVNVQNDDRAAALVLGSILEQGLETSIFSHCVFGWTEPTAEEEQKRLFGGDTGAMTFAMKIRLAFALGVYGPNSRDDLEIVRHIRNLFAHDKGHLSFEDGVVVALCGQIKWIDRLSWGGLAGPKPLTPRAQYIETIRHYFAYLDGGTGKGVPIKYLDFVEFGSLYT